MSGVVVSLPHRVSFCWTPFFFFQKNWHEVYRHSFYFFCHLNVKCRSMGLNFFCFIPIFKYDIKVISFLTLWEGVEYCSGMIYQLKLKIVQSQKIYLKIWDVGPDHILLQNCKLKDMRYLIIRQYVMCGRAKIKECFV